MAATLKATQDTTGESTTDRVALQRCHLCVRACCGGPLAQQRCAARGEAAFQTKGNGIEDGRRSVRLAGSGWPLSGGHIHGRARRNATLRKQYTGTPCTPPRRNEAGTLSREHCRARAHHCGSTMQAYLTPDAHSLSRTKHVTRRSRSLRRAERITRWKSTRDVC